MEPVQFLRAVFARAFFQIWEIVRAQIVPFSTARSSIIPVSIVPSTGRMSKEEIAPIVRI